MKIIATDNFDRDDKAEFVVCRFPPVVDKIQAEAIATILNSISTTNASEYYFVAAEDNKELNFPSWWEPVDCISLPMDKMDLGLLYFLKDRYERPDDERREWNGIEENVLISHFIQQLAGKI